MQFQTVISIEVGTEFGAEGGTLSVSLISATLPGFDVDSHTSVDDSCACVSATGLGSRDPTIWGCFHCMPLYCRSCTAEEVEVTPTDGDDGDGVGTGSAGAPYGYLICGDTCSDCPGVY